MPPKRPTVIEREPSSEDVQFLEDRLYENNAAKTGQDDGRSFSFWIQDEQGEPVGGLTGWTWAHACEIQTLWVHPAYRQRGYASTLLNAAEEKARVSGCQVILLRTYSFQAPGLYQKHGFELAYKLVNFPPGHADNFMVKRLAPAA